VDVVVEFSQSKGVGEKGYWVKFIINDDRKDCSESTVGSIGFNYKLMVQKPMIENWRTGESLFQHLESGAALVIEVSQSTCPGEPS